MFLYLYLYSKFALIFPIAAAAHNISLKKIFGLSSLKKTFGLSKGYFWKILGGFLTVIISSIIIKKIIIASFAIPVYLSPFFLIIDFILVAINASWLSKIYREINS
jgi:hypothetical protein